jgi:hypothetical protein
LFSPRARSRIGGSEARPISKLIFSSLIDMPHRYTRHLGNGTWIPLTAGNGPFPCYRSIFLGFPDSMRSDGDDFCFHLQISLHLNIVQLSKQSWRTFNIKEVDCHGGATAERVALA